MNNRYLTYILIFVLIIASFYWGYSSHKNRTFPYGLLQNSEQGPNRIENMTLDAKALKTLPYVMGKTVPDDKKSVGGVLINEPEFTYKGYNLFNSNVSETAYLVDMDGNIVHQWTGKETKNWHHVVLDGHGNLYVIRYKDGLVKLDIDSNTVFDLKIRAHHDLDVTPRGDIYVINDKVEPFPELYGREPVLSDYITHVSKTGEVIDEISIIKAIYESPYRMLLPTFTKGIHHMDGHPDILHTNSVELLDGNASSVRNGVFRAGNILFSCRELNFIGILDPDTRKVVWGWGAGNIHGQHDASMLPNGDILMFDNGKAFSRAVEIDPHNGKLVWDYDGKKNGYIISRTMGAAQRLPNGNTLITVAEECYAIEVTPDGRVVWKYLNPMMYETDGTLKRQMFYRVTRVPIPVPDIYATGNRTVSPPPNTR